MKKRITTLIAAIAITLVATTPASAWAVHTYLKCDPGRASNATGNSVYIEVTESNANDAIDDVTGNIPDMEPFIETNADPSYSYIALRKDANNFIQFGTKLTSGHTHSIFGLFVRNGVSYFYTRPYNNGLLNDPLNGDGSQDKFLINHSTILFPPFNGIFQMKLNGEVLFTTPEFGDMWTADTARVVYAFGDAGSQWFGMDDNPKWYGTQDVLATMDDFGESHLPYGDWTIHNDTNKAQTRKVDSGGGRLDFMVWDEDCN
jgi:hypothetical protein